MANITLFEPVDMRGDFVSFGDVTSATATEIVATAAGGFVVTLTGSFTYDAFMMPSGTITRVEQTLNGNPLATITDIAYDVGATLGVVQTGTREEIIDFLFSEDDTTRGSNGRDVLFGSFGDDVTRGRGGKDRIDGEEGADRLFGGNGADLLLGGAGSDQLKGDDGEDTLKGGGGRDRAWGGGDDDTVLGQGGNDRLGGNAGNDRLEGGAGNDRLSGDAGRDVLKGGAGNDRLDGGPGNDKLTGGSGNDTFVFELGESGKDRITDFDAASDAIEIAGADADDVTVMASGGDTEVTFDGATIVLVGVTLSEGDIDFVFV